MVGIRSRCFLLGQVRPIFRGVGELLVLGSPNLSGIFLEGEEAFWIRWGHSVMTEFAWIFFCQLLTGMENAKQKSSEKKGGPNMEKMWNFVHFYCFSFCWECSLSLGSTECQFCWARKTLRVKVLQPEDVSKTQPRMGRNHLVPNDFRGLLGCPWYLINGL